MEFEHFPKHVPVPLLIPVAIHYPSLHLLILTPILPISISTYLYSCPLSSCLVSSCLFCHCSALSCLVCLVFSCFVCFLLFRSRKAGVKSYSLALYCEGDASTLCSDLYFFAVILSGRSRVGQLCVVPHGWQTYPYLYPYPHISIPVILSCLVSSRFICFCSALSCLACLVF